MGRKVLRSPLAQQSSVAPDLAPEFSPGTEHVQSSYNVRMGDAYLAQLPMRWLYELVGKNCILNSSHFSGLYHSSYRTP